jgi:hypothetical protein
MTAIDPSTIDYSKFYTWDAIPGNGEAGNTLMVPNGFNFDYVFDKLVTVTWKDIKPGSPTKGQARTTDAPFLKPEAHKLFQAEAPDIPFLTGQTVTQKTFKAWGPEWFVYSVPLLLRKGAKFRLTWPVWPNLVMDDTGGVKKYADDPAAGWFRLRVKEGEAALKCNPASDGPDASWYNGLDFAFGHWAMPQVIVDCTQDVMTVGLECVSLFGLKDSDFILGEPIVELVSDVVTPASGGAPGTTTTVPTEPPVTPGAAGTLRAALQKLSTDAAAAANLGADVQAVLTIVG